MKNYQTGSKFFMSLYLIKGYNENNKKLKKQAPVPFSSDSSLRFDSISSSNSFTIGIDINGTAYIWGKWNATDKLFPDEVVVNPTVIPGIPDMKVLSSSCSSRDGGVIMENKSVFIWGQDFSPTPVQICEPGEADIFCVGLKAVAIYGKSGLRIYSAPNAFIEVKIGENSIKMICALRDSFAVLLDSGELCTIKQISSIVNFTSKRNDDLHYLMSFFGCNVSFITSGYSYFLVVTSEGGVFICNSDETVFTPIQIPAIFSDDSLCYAEIADGRIYLITYSGRLHVFLINKLLSGKWIKKIQLGIVESDLNFTHVSASVSNAYFLVNGRSHYPLSVVYTPNLLISRKSPLYIQLGKKSIFVDPTGAERYGFCPGDIVKKGEDAFTVIGATEHSLLLFNCSNRSFLEIESGKHSEIMLQLSLIGRIGSDLHDVYLKNDINLAVDKSHTIMSQITSFKAGDIIFESRFGKGVVMGARADNVVIQYEGGVKLAKYMTADQIMMSHSLIHREGKKVIQQTTVDGNLVLIEECGCDSMATGCIVVHNTYGIGEYIGCHNEHMAIKFIRDSNCIRLICGNQKLGMIRTCCSFIQGYLGINRETAIIDVQIQKSRELGYFPGDMIKINKYCACCIGSGYIYNEQSLFFETDEMILCNLGVGIFGKGKMTDKGELLARIASPGTRFMKTENGELIELSVNTDDFLTSPLLPLDRIIINGSTAIVVGLHDSQLYIQFENTNYAQPLSGKYHLILRRFNIPTMKIVNAEFNKITYNQVMLHVDYYRGMWFMPGDIVEQENENYRVIGMLENRLFLVKSLKTGEQSARILNPCGVLTANLIHRASFFQ